MAQTAPLIETGLAGGDDSPANRFTGWTQVGQGGSAEVFKVHDRELKVQLAVKILKQDLRHDTRYIESLRREVLISRRLRHPNICPIHDLYEGERGVGIVMDFIEGEDLKAWLRTRRGTLLDTVTDRVTLLSKLAEALTIAHSMIVHRDLKPANIFLLKGDITNPVIMDFGLSIPDDVADSNLDGGTPKYMAPEQYLRAQKIDQRADLYSLGILAYELLSDGHIPACSLKDVAKTGKLPQFDRGDILPPSTFCAAIPHELDRLILQLIEHDPERRPNTAAEVGGALSTVKLLDPFRPNVQAGKAATAKIAAGVYVVGDKTGGRACDQPQRKIKLAGFSMAASPVTNADYRRFIAATGYRAPALLDHPKFGGDLQPVVMVSWEDAAAYARWDGGRLPYELEWEVAAKGGNTDHVFPWGNGRPQITQANIDNICPAPTPVGAYPAGKNPLGMLDCCGNVWEWCADFWDDALLKLVPGDNNLPVAQGKTDLRPVRGGSFDAPLIAGRTTFRHRILHNATRADLGFRVAYDA